MTIIIFLLNMLNFEHYDTKDTAIKSNSRDYTSRLKYDKRY